MNEKEIMEKLKAPFKEDEIEWRVGVTNTDKTKGLALAYVTNRAIQNRLDEVFGCFGWKNEFKEWKGGSQLCGISVNFNDEWITKWDGADNSQTESVKGGLSDSMKRAAYQWGIARYLYDIPQIWVDLEPHGKSYRIKTTPKLPNWATNKSEIVYITDKHARELLKLVEGTKYDINYIFNYYKVNSLTELTEEQYNKLKEHLNSKLNKKKSA